MAIPMYPHEVEKFQNESIYPAILALEKHETVSFINITSIISNQTYTYYYQKI